MSDTSLSSGAGHRALGLPFERSTLFWVAGGLLTAFALTLLAAPGALSIDSAVYIDMARSMVEHGSLTLPNETLPGSPALKTRFSHVVESGLAPQYPGFYGILAAPFYALGGIRGLIFMNALAAVVAVLMTHRIALRLYGDATIAGAAAGLLAVATFLSGYATAVWPHVFTLALILLAVERVIAAADAEAGGWKAGLLAGLVFGFAMAIRVDAILPLLGALVWLRLFGAPGKRVTALALLAGLVPGLFVSALINWQKFGLFMPFSYGPTDRTSLFLRYLPALLTAGAMLAAVMLIDARKPWVSSLVNRMRSPVGLIFIAAGFALAVILVAPLRSFMLGVYALAVDLHRLGEAHLLPGTIRQENGLIAFWGSNKLALLQSVPFAALALIPLAQLIRGHEQARAHALMIGTALVPILAYAVDHWHGGLSRAMRYLIPALPMLAILGAVVLTGIGAFKAKHRRAMLYSGAAGAGLVLAGDHFSRGLTSADAIAFEYWPTMLVLATVTLASLAYLIRPSGLRCTQALRLAGGLGVGAAIMISLTTLSWYQVRISHKAAQDRVALERLAPGSLVLMRVEERFVSAKANGVRLMTIDANRLDELRAAEAAWTAEGLCTYVEASGLEAELTLKLGGSWEAVELGDGFTLLTRAGTAERCADHPPSRQRSE